MVKEVTSYIITLLLRAWESVSKDVKVVRIILYWINKLVKHKSQNI